MRAVFLLAVMETRTILTERLARRHISIGFRSRCIFQQSTRCFILVDAFAVDEKITLEAEDPRDGVAFSSR